MAVASVTTDQILQAYRDTLGRTPGPEEVNFWVNYSTTNDPTQTANAFLAGAQNELASRQAINIPAATSSDLVLNLPTRTTIPEPANVGTLASATGPVRPVAQPSVTSDQIVESYTKYLNRTPSADEVSFWTNYSTTNNPTQTAEAFLAGAKNEIANVTKSGYESYLGRTPSPEELNFWTNYTVEQGAPQAAAAWKAGADQELASQNKPPPSQTNQNVASSVTEQQILDSYSKFLNRKPSAEEVSFWVDYGRTANPTQTADAFINSARKEIGDITKSGYTSYLGREPTQQELDFWTNYTIQNDAVQAANAWKAGADEELARRTRVSDATTDLQKSNLTGSLVSESTAGIPYGGGIYKRTPDEEARYLSELSRIPVSTAVPLPVMPMSLGPSDALTRARQPGDIGEGAYYAAIRDVVTSGDYTPAQLRQMQRNVGTSGQDINVAFGRGMTPISTTTPTLPGATTGTTQSIDQFIQSKAPTSSVAMPTAPSMFSPENVAAQLELERLRLKPTPEKPVAGFAQGGLVGDDINRMLQNQRNAVQRESQSRQMLTNLGAPPVKKFSDGGPAGSSSGVRRLKMSGYQEGGEVTDDMFVGTLPTDQGTSPGILPPEIRQAVDVPLDFANLLIRGTAAVPIGGFAGLYKGITGGKYGTQEGVKEADTEAARMMAKITGEPKTQTAKDVLQFVGDKMQKYKLDAAMPQLLTLPSPGAGTTEFIKQAVRSEFEAPPVGAVDIGALMPKPKKGVELSEQEVGKLVDSSQVSDEQAPALVETARRVKEIFNTNQGWEPMELIRAKIKPGKEDNLAVDLEAQKIPYNFHIVPEGMAKPAWEKKISNGIVGEVRKVVERAKAGDQKALDILGQASWYRSMRKRLRTEFGSIGDVFADVLGTTSAQTGVEQNFNNAIEILRRYSRGDYDKELKAYEDRLKSGESMDGTELTQLHKKGEFPLITKASGALFNANSPSSMGALLDMFRSVRTGDSPKTPNFTGNLIGLTNEATVDVWAARLLRRLSGKKRIPPMAEKGVSGKHLVGSTLYEPKVGGEFGFGQKVFKDAANRINKTGVIKNFDPNIGDVGPDDLQAIAWFIEKERWTDNGWTSKAGEGGSLEYEMSFAGAPNQAMVNDLRREINKGFKEPPQRKKESDQDHALRVEAAQQAYDVNRQNLINQLALLKKDVDRYQIGLSGERPGKPLASGYQRAELAAGVDDVVRDDQNVIAYNLTNSYGSFMSEVERALNGEFVVRGNFDPIPLERRVVELGKEYDQDAVFLSKVLPDGQSPNARPGIEIYFKEKVSPEQMAKVTERLRNYGVDGFTYVTDMRFSDRPGMQVRAGSPETAELTGLRFQYVPEFDDAYSPETRGAIIKEKERLYREILRGIITDGNVSDARMLYYDTKVFLKGGYDEYLARTTPGGSGRVRPGQPDSSDTARSAQGAAVGAELSGDVRDGRDQATRAPAAGGVAPEIGINVASDIKAGAKYADLIVDGQKTLESRDTDSLRPYVGKRVAIVRTGEGQAKAIGAATIGEPILVDAKKFRELQNQHLVPEGSKFDIKGGNKYLYPIIDPERFGTEQEVGKGIVARRVRGKGTTSAAEDLAAVSPTAPAESRVEKTKIKKAKGGEVSITDFIKRAA